MRVIITPEAPENEYDQEMSPDFADQEGLAGWIENHLLGTATEEYTQEVMSWVESDRFLTESLWMTNGNVREEWSVI